MVQETQLTSFKNDLEEILADEAIGDIEVTLQLYEDAIRSKKAMTQATEELIKQYAGSYLKNMGKDTKLKVGAVRKLEFLHKFQEEFNTWYGKKEALSVTFEPSPFYQAHYDGMVDYMEHLLKDVTSSSVKMIAYGISQLRDNFRDVYGGDFDLRLDHKMGGKPTKHEKIKKQYFTKQGFPRGIGNWMNKGIIGNIETKAHGLQHQLLEKAGFSDAAIKYIYNRIGSMGYEYRRN